MSRSGSDTIVCELCGVLVYWDWETGLWRHIDTNRVKCKEPEHQEHYG